MSEEEEEFLKYVEEENKKSEQTIKINGDKAKDAYKNFKKAI